MLMAAFCAMFLVLLASDIADAKRFGGGRSFGGKKSYSNNYSKPTSPDRNNAGDQRQAASNRQGTDASQGASKRGMFGGMIGGLLMGGLLGSLLFGGGFGGMGILELLLLGFVGYMIFKVVRSRRAAAQAAAAGGDRYAYAGAPAGPSAGGAGGWDALRSEPAGRPQPQTSAAPAMPEGIDEAEFIEGAKALYARLQSSWDRRDLDDIRSFTSSEVYEEIARQAQEDSAPGNTDILMIEARVLEARTEGSETIITVLYDALLREDANADRPTQVREVWHFHRDNTAPNPEWRLEGIQQLDS
ncbi:Tim44 domain-containing protein [Oceanidesulfovibrio indonesiensis]|uniref:Tim44 domain-containing protein n=2 Tax=Oceanidesulfovibrio indonesiensis TaxID=54767 RepID=A0A7M3MGN8_9BACT|nr:Tim44 domain-containing protein [Oceanidesulfovibrio indonesiensis]